MENKVQPIFCFHLTVSTTNPMDGSRGTVRLYVQVGYIKLHTDCKGEILGSQYKICAIFHIFFFQHQVRCLGVWCVAMGDCHLGIESVSRDERK